MGGEEREGLGREGINLLHGRLKTLAALMMLANYKYTLNTEQNTNECWLTLVSASSAPLHY